MGRLVDPGNGPRPSTAARDALKAFDALAVESTDTPLPGGDEQFHTAAAGGTARAGGFLAIAPERAAVVVDGEKMREVLATAAEAEAKPATPADSYSDRLVKYIPSETVAAFLAANAAIVSTYGLKLDGSTTNPDDGLLVPISLLTFLVLLVGTPVYFWLRRDREKDAAGRTKPWFLNTLIATISFVVWAYSIGGAIFIVQGWYVPLVAGLLTILFTFAAPLLAPKEAT